MSELYPDWRLKIREADIGPNQFAVTKVYSVPNDDAETVRLNLRNSIADEYGGAKTAPICISAESDKGYYEHGAFARVIAQYRTPNWQEWMMENLNQGLVFVTPIQSYQQYTRDLDDFLLNGDDENTSDYKFWRQELGENFGLRTKYRIDVKAVIDVSHIGLLTEYSGLLGRVNSTALVNLGPAGDIVRPGHNLFLGCSENRILADSTLIDVTWSFMYNAENWNEQCKSIQYEQADVEFGYDRWVDGTLQTGGLRWKSLNIRTGEPPHSARLHLTANFASIDQICIPI